MTSQSGRRTPARGGRPGGRSGPGRSTSRPAAPARTAARASKPEPTRTAPARPAPSGVTRKQRPTPKRGRPRFTGRAAILVLVLAVLAVSSASSLRSYLVQRHHIQSLQEGNRQLQAETDAQEREVAQFDDPDYVETLARLRLGVVKPGETPYVVLDDGVPLDAESSLTDPSTIDPPEPKAWWDDAWDTVLVAGHPPKRTDPPPATRIDDPEGAPSD